LSFWQQLGRQDQALAHAAENMAGGFGHVADVEKKLRQDLPEWLSKTLFFDKPMDQLLEEGSHKVGPLPMAGAAAVGGVGPAKFLPESWLMPGTGARGVAARTAASGADTAVLNLDNADEGEQVSGTEGTGTSMTLQLLGEALGKGMNVGGKKFRQKDMPDLAKSEEKMAPTIREWLKNVPYGPSPIPDADTRTLLGPDVLPVIASEKSKAPGAYSKMQQDAQARREGELERAQKKGAEITGVSPLDTAEGQERAYKEKRLAPNMSAEYTQALKAPFSNTSVQTKTGKMIVPIPLKGTLTSSPRFYEAWVKAGEGSDGGLARAEVQAKKRGTTATKAEIAWHTIQKLENGGQAEQELAALLKKDMGNNISGVKDLNKKQYDLGQQERGAQLGNKIYTDPGNLDKATHQVLKDPAAMKAAGDAFVARFVEDSSKGSLPKLTQQMRATAAELLGEQRASDLFRHYETERVTRRVDEPLKEGAGVSADALTPKTGKFRQMMGAVARVLAASPGGAPAMLGAAGPAAARFLRDHPNVLSGQDVEGLFSLLRKKPEELPNPKLNRYEKAKGFTGSPGAVGYVDQDRRARRYNKGQE
jgi:hypothetical protein